MLELNLQSIRLNFRPVQECDLDLAIEMFTDPDVMKYLGGETFSPEDIAEEMPTNTKRCAAGAIGIWCIVDKESAEKLGSVFFFPLPIEEEDTNWDLVEGDDLPNGDIEIGYCLKKSAWGRGVGSEACQRLLRFAFEQTELEEVFAVIDADNLASKKILEKNGLSYRGERKAYSVMGPGFSITRREWQEKQRSQSLPL